MREIRLARSIVTPHRGVIHPFEGLHFLLELRNACFLLIELLLRLSERFLNARALSYRGAHWYAMKVFKIRLHLFPM